MTHLAARRWLFAVLLAATVGCGVQSQEQPQPIDDSTRESGTTPSVECHPGPTPTVTDDPTASTSTPSTTTAGTCPP